ncbi:MAG: hypothetical protein J5I98_09745, partial [Phaeodactylibacter sp.]|nr:hypothetical protein [Phaeodactylibacter sp.]
MKTFLFSISAILLPILVMAQIHRNPRVDITANPLDWSNQKANLCAQVMVIPRIGLWTSVDFLAAEGKQGNFFAQSEQLGANAEIRLFLFGDPNLLTLSFKNRKPGSGCYQFGFRKKSNNNILYGIYIAPGVIYWQERLTFVPVLDNETTIDIDYLIKSKGGSLALGYQARFGCLTLGIGWVLRVSQPQWSGPADIF